MPTALIVEDEPEANKLLAMLVKLRGFQTVSAFGGNEAIAKALECEPDVVFLDLMLPDMNGYEVCRILKSRQPTSGIPVVIVTARVAADNRLESFSNGADDYIPKPYTPDQIFTCLARASEWKSELESPRVDGSLTLDRARTETLRELARLRSLLFARTSLGFKTVEHVFAEIQRIRNFADRWAIDHPAGKPLRLEYTLDADHLEIRIRDDSPWIQAYHARVPDSAPVEATDEPHFIATELDGPLACLVMKIPLPKA